MWDSIKKLIHPKVSKLEILKKVLYNVESEAEKLYHLKLSLQNQISKLKTNIGNLQKHIKKNDFDIKAAMGNDDKTKALELNSYGQTIKKERNYYNQSIKDLEHKLLEASCQISTLQIQQEKISTQIVFLRGNSDRNFEIEDFLFEVFNEIDSLPYEAEDILSLEIDMALEESEEVEESKNKIDTFFKNPAPSASVSHDEEEKESLINSFFKKPKEKTNQQKKIDDFFNKG